MKINTYFRCLTLIIHLRENKEQREQMPNFTCINLVITLIEKRSNLTKSISVTKEAYVEKIKIYYSQLKNLMIT